MQERKTEKFTFSCRQALAHGFDLVVFLEEELNSAHLELEYFAKVYAFFAFKAFNNCAFVYPGMLALKNCDEIFSEETETIAMGNIGKRASVFLFRPSTDNYNTITVGLKEFWENGMSTLYFLNLIRSVRLLYF